MGMHGTEEMRRRCAMSGGEVVDVVFYSSGFLCSLGQGVECAKMCNHVSAMGRRIILYVRV